MTKRWLRKVIEEEAINCHISDIDFLDTFRECCPKDRLLLKMLREIEKDFIREMRV